MSGAEPAAPVPAAPDPAVRLATDADWEQIWPFWAETVRAGETYAYPEDATSEEARELWLGEARSAPRAEVVVLVEDGVVLGSAKYGPNRPARGDHVGTASFMVSPAARGRGVGRRLGTHVVVRLAELGFEAIQFNAVVETNTAAVELWRSLGFEIVGTVPGAFRSREHGRVGLHVMLLPLVKQGPDADENVF